MKLFFVHSLRHRLQSLLRIAGDLEEVSVGRHQSQLDAFLPLMRFYRGFIQFVAWAHVVVAVVNHSVVAKIWLPDGSPTIADDHLVMIAVNVWEVAGLVYLVGYFTIQYDSMVLALLWSCSVHFRALRVFFEDVGKGREGVRREIERGVERHKVLYELRGCVGV